MEKKMKRMKATANAAAMFLVAGIAAVSCTKDNVGVPPVVLPDGKVMVRADISGFYGAGHALEGENDVKDMQACIFENGRMTHVYENLSSSGGFCGIELDSHSGTLYMLANTGGLVDLDELRSQDITEEEWLRLDIAPELGEPVHFFTGSVSLDGMEKSQTEIPLSLKRGVARFDLQLRTAGESSVERVTLRNAAESAYLFPVADGHSPSDVSRSDFSREFDSPLTSDTQGVLYVYEQHNDNIEIVVDAMIDGREVTLSKTLSEPLKRNTVYTVTVRKDVIDVSLEVSFEDWEQGGDTELVPVRRSI